MLRWLLGELRSLAWLTFYFAACFVVIMLLKHLWLEVDTSDNRSRAAL
jgi:hypothetical protein